MTETTTYQQATATESAGNARRLAGVALLGLSAQFITVIMLAAAMAPNYDFGASAISDLGVIPETALLFNASLVLVGLLNVAGGYYLYRVHGARWLFGLYVVAGVGAVGTGLFPLDTGAPHSLFALLAFVGFNIQAIGTATRVTGLLRPLSVVAGVVGLVFVVIMALGDAGNTALFGPIGHGGTERMIVYPAMLWLLVFGGYLLGRGTTRSPTADSEPVTRLL